MSVTIDDVKYIAKLSMLKFEEEELTSFTQEFNKILEYMDQLNELDLTDVAPLYHPIETGKGQLRKDEVKDSLPIEKTFLNAPAESEQHFSVPKVIKEK